MIFTIRLHMAINSLFTCHSFSIATEILMVWLFSKGYFGFVISESVTGEHNYKLNHAATSKN